MPTSASRQASVWGTDVAAAAFINARPVSMIDRFHTFPPETVTIFYYRSNGRARRRLQSSVFRPKKETGVPFSAIAYRSAVALRSSRHS
ncbi:hypothetical protein BN2476_360041 [Paraburkholderia piptadeniae]|uniref:Uncharacterized protein n=1 Tax=Paraburkholderia piptadeniae TaxID=1701573 RepID=A0A1N7S970_9BURK|nr:hypothetical protein BN2476_360041 [Paraburkholderia piptadeniae]